MYKVDDKAYELKYSDEILEKIEETENIAILGYLGTKMGFSLKIIKTFFVMGLIDVKTRKPVDQQEAQDIFKKVKNREGIPKIFIDITEQIRKDCPFLFKEPTA